VDPSTPVGGESLPPDGPAPASPVDPVPGPEPVPPVVAVPAPADPLPPVLAAPGPGGDGSDGGDEGSHPKPSDPAASDPMPADAPASDGPAPRPAVVVLAPVGHVVRVATVVALPAPLPVTAPTAAASVAPVGGSERSLVIARARAATPRALLAAAASAGLLPFAPRDPGHRGRMHPDLDAIAAGAPASAMPATAAGGGPDAAPRGSRAPARHGGGGTPPLPSSPFGPPGNAGAGGAAGAAGGAAAGVWCALLIGGLVLLAQPLRRYRFRLVVPAPRGVVLLLQRPG
jgi:hypothetical protein